MAWEVTLSMHMGHLKWLRQLRQGGGGAGSRVSRSKSFYTQTPEVNATPVKGMRGLAISACA